MYLHKTIFLIILLSSTMIWMGLEINILSFIPLMKDKNNPLSSEGIVKYFIVQVLASTMLMLSMLNPYINPNLIILMSMSIKLGLVPFHFWYPMMLEGISWMNCLILSTWQKFSLSMTILTNLTSSFLSMNFSSLRKMSFSSLNNISWMIH